VKPLFPFGYGLSYTTFKIAGIKASETKVAKNGSLSVEANITNTGDRAGAEVVQLYVGESNPVVPRPVKELKGFDKIFLNPGETRTISIPLKYEDFAYWDVKTHGWKVNADTYKLYVGVSSADIIGTLDVKVK
jgi:beta-glucosidase